MQGWVEVKIKVKVKIKIKVKVILRSLHVYLTFFKT